MMPAVEPALEPVVAWQVFDLGQVLAAVLLELFEPDVFMPSFAGSSNSVGFACFADLVALVATELFKALLP